MVMPSKARYQPLRVGNASNPGFRLVFLHGFGWHSSPYADGIRAIVREDGEGLLYDLPGHGREDRRLNPDSIKDLAASIAQQVAVSSHHVPVVVSGESLGCAYVPSVVDQLEETGNPAVGAVLFAPPVLLNAVTIARWAARTLLHAPGHAGRGRIPIEEPLMELVRDRRQAQTLAADPLFRRTVSWPYLMRSLADVSALACRLKRITSV